MTVSKTRDNDSLTMAVAGRVDSSTAPQLGAEITTSVEGVKSLTIDLKDLEYISSAGLRVLLATHKTMAGNGGSMTVTNVNPTVMEVFEITGFNNILDIK